MAIYGFYEIKIGNTLKKILYISPEHISGTLPLFCKGHKERGNYARYLTMFHTMFDFPEDMTLNLPLHPDNKIILKGRQFIHRLRGIPHDFEPSGNPPFWKPAGMLERMFFKYRDFRIKKKVYSFMEENDIWKYDIYHLEQGMDFFRDSRVMQKLKSMGKKIVCFYHGTDVRNRGVIPEIHRISDLNLTSELDLLDKYPGIRYLFLPIDTNQVVPVPHKNEKVRIAHAARSRANKGTDFILNVVSKLERKYPVEMVLIENLPHAECMKIKETCDIYIDQLADRGGWGYGMSSVESMAQGLATCTFLNQKYLEFLPDHGFVNVNYNNLEEELIKLITNDSYRKKMASTGRAWVIKRHDFSVVMNDLYKYYEEAGILN
jgi:glycosyltransferase involved in cell wall biosynthesis